MSIWERLAERGIDFVVGEARADKQAHRELAAALDAELRTYSTSIERLRVELHDLRQHMLDGQPATEAQVRRLEAATDQRPGGFDASAQAIYLQIEAAGLGSEAHRAAANVMAIRLDHELAGTPAPKPDPTEAVQLAQRQLDVQWAEVRPLLDDCVELECVQALRVARHRVRQALSVVVPAVRDASSMDNPGDIEHAVTAIDTVLRIADRWHVMIWGTRRNADK